MMMFAVRQKKKKKKKNDRMEKRWLSSTLRNEMNDYEEKKYRRDEKRERDREENCS